MAFHFRPIPIRHLKRQLICITIASALSCAISPPSRSCNTFDRIIYKESSKRFNPSIFYEQDAELGQNGRIVTRLAVEDKSTDIETAQRPFL